MATSENLSNNEIPQWEKDLIDERLAFIKKHTEQLIPIEDFIAELDKDIQP